MIRNQHPDASIGAWLADGPTTLSPQRRDVVKAAVRRTPQRRLVILPLPSARGVRLAFAAAALVVAALAIAVGAGSLRLLAPAPSETPRPSLGGEYSTCWGDLRSQPVPARGSFELGGTRLSIEYAMPAGLALEAGLAGGVVGFGTPSGLPASADSGIGRRFAPGSHGVLVADVTGAVRHGTLIEQPKIGTDARTFLEDLDEPFSYPAGVIDFEVEDITETELAGIPAWSARVSVPDLDPPMWTHIDRGSSPLGCAVEFGMPNRVWVVDVADWTVLVQAWSADEAGLAAWQPEALRLIESFRFRSGSPRGATAAPATDTPSMTAYIRRPWLTLSFDYQLPAALDLSSGQDSEGSYRWFTEGATGVRGRGARGVIVEEVTNASAHYTGRQILGTDAASFLAGMAANEEFTVGEVAATTLDGRPALTADVTSGHFDVLFPDSASSILSLAFVQPSRLIVADIDGAIVAVQIWAATAAELEAWLPQALEFVDSMRFRVYRPI